MCSMLFDGVVTILIDDIITITVTLIVAIILIVMHEDGGGIFMVTARAAKPHPQRSPYASLLETLWG